MKVAGIIKKSNRIKTAKRIVPLAVMSIGALAVLAGCGATPVTHAASATAGKETPGGIIVYAQSPQTVYNWYLPITDAAYDYNAGLYDEIYKPLLWINNNYSINWKSSIADKVTYNKTGTVYHVFMNPKWTWSNGQHVTSRDVVFTWQVIKAASASNAPTPWPYVGAGTGDIPTGVQSVVENSSYEFTVTLKNPTSPQWFIYNGLIQLVPMPAAVWDIHKNIEKEIKYLGSEAMNPQFVSVVDGPFKLGKVIPDQLWTLVPNTAYAGHKSIVKKIILDYEASSTSAFTAMKTGTVSIDDLDPSEWSARGSLTSQGDVITPEYTFGYYDTALNMFPGSPDRKIFSQLYVRQAMQMGLNNEAINKAVYHGFAPPIDGPLPSVPMTKFYDTALNTNPYPFNPARGKKLLEDHGWHIVDKVMTKGSEQMKFTLLYPSGTVSETDTAELMQQEWAEEGIDVSLRPMPFGQLMSDASSTNAKGWSMATGFGWDYDGPGFYPSGGGLFGTNAPSGFGYSNKEEDALIAATHLPSANAAATTKTFDAYEKFTALHLPVLWQNNQAALVAHAPDIHGSVKYDDSATGIPPMQYWWVSSSSPGKS